MTARVNDALQAAGHALARPRNVLRAHAAAVAAFRQLVPGGRIAMALNSDWTEPLTSSAEDKARAPGTRRCMCPCHWQRNAANICKTWR